MAEPDSSAPYPWTVIIIGGREAVPVRALPLVNPLLLFPERVVDDMLQDDTRCRPEFSVIPGLKSYRLDRSGQPIWLPPSQWMPVYDAVYSLSHELDERGLARPELGCDYPPRDAVYNREVLPRLPSGVFVWKDELEAAFRPSRFNMAQTKAERNSPLCFNPIADSALTAVVLEGFEQPPAPAPKAALPPADKALDARERATLLVIIEALAREAKIDTSRHEAAGVTIAALVDQMGARVDDSTIARHLKRIPAALEAKAKEPRKSL